MAFHSFRKSTVQGLSFGIASLLGATGVAVAQKAPAGQACTSSAWTGTVSYSRNQNMSDNKTIERVSGRGKDTRDFQMNYNYKAVVAVTEDRARKGTSVGKAQISHSMSSTETSHAQELNS